MIGSFLVALALLAVLFSSASAASVASLGKYNISDVTVSGLSAGAFMAVQVHVALSSTIKGAAVFAGGPYDCARGNLMYAEGQCMGTYLGTPNVDVLVSSTRQNANRGLIDSVDNMQDDPVYLFSGKGDTVVDPKVMQALQSYYLYFVKATNIVADYNLDAQHCIPTLDYGEACTRLSSPYIGKCNFDGAGAAMQTLYGVDLAPGTAVASHLTEFDQTPFFSGTKTSLATSGFIYVPSSCADGKTSCRLHISFHGCNQDQKSIGNAYAVNAGFNRWAEANNIIVLYPYVTTSTMPSNPNACWDWWAYTGSDYVYKTGVQISFVQKLINQIKLK